MPSDEFQRRLRMQQEVLEGHRIFYGILRLFRTFYLDGGGGTGDGGRGHQKVAVANNPADLVTKHLDARLRRGICRA